MKTQKMKKLLSILLAVLTIASTGVFAAFADNVACEETAEEEIVIPENYTSARKYVVPEVRNQGDAGLDWAFTVTDMLEINAAVKGYEKAYKVDFSESYLNWYLTKNGGENDFYNNFDECAYRLFPNPVIRNEKDYPLTATDFEVKYSEYTHALYSDDDLKDYYSSKYAVSSYKKLTTEEQIKKWIMENGSAGVTLTLNCISNGVCCSFTDVKTKCNSATVIGWNDGFYGNGFETTSKVTGEVIRPEGNGAWLCKYSKGTEWGSSGYFWLSFEDASAEFFGLTLEKTNFNYVYSYGDTGFSESSYSKNKQMKECNVFEVKHGSYLKSVTFAASAEKAEAYICIRELTEDCKTVESGGIVGETYVDIDGAGIYTVEVPKSLNRRWGTYSVMVRFYIETPFVQVDSDEISVPIKKNTTEATPGQSYLATSSGWTDFSQTGNFYINLNVTDITKPDTIEEDVEKTAEDDEIVEFATFHDFITALKNVIMNVVEFFRKIFSKIGIFGK